MKMKPLCLALAMALLLAGCGGQSTAEPPAASNSTAAPTEAPTPEPTPTPTPEPTLPPVEGQVLLEQDGLTITAQSVTFPADFDPGELAIQLENSTDSAIRVQLGGLKVNGYMFYGEMDVEVPAGGTADGSIPISSLGMYQAGLPTASEMEFDFLLTAGGDTTRTGICHLDIPDGNTRMPSDLKDTVYADDLVRIACQYYNIKNVELETTLQNVSDRYLKVKLVSLKLNGEIVTPNGSDEQLLMPGAFAYFYPYIPFASDQLYEALDAMAMEQDARLPVEAQFLILDADTGEQLSDTGVLTFEVGFDA